LPPVYCEDGRVLVDGSLLDNVPVKSMRALKSGPNVVIGLKSDELRGDTVDYAALPSRGRMLPAAAQSVCAPPAPPRPRRG
jgi:NTE family protein